MVHGLGERLLASRINLKLSQKEVATAIRVSPSLISNYENGERSPSIESLMALANLYHCSTDYLLGLDKNQSGSTLDVSSLNQEQVRLLRAFLASLK